MFEHRRRQILVFFIGLTICISIWRMSVQEPPLQQLPLSSTTQIEEIGKEGNGSIAAMLTTFSSPKELLYNLTRLPNEDFSKLIDFTNFTFLISQPYCEASLLFVILVHSAPSNFEKRTIIRQTWGSIKTNKFRVMFLLAITNSSIYQDYIDQENQTYSDIIQGNFVDDYQNLTYKHVMGLKWFLYNCRNAKYLVKTDDDIFVNIKMLYPFLLDRRNYGIRTLEELTVPSNSTDGSTYVDDKDFLYCRRIVGSIVHRSYRSKWRVSFNDYHERLYPPYCPGFAIIYSNDVVHRLYTEAQKSKYFWVDDVLITGILSERLNISITTLRPYYFKQKQYQYLFNGLIDFGNSKYLFSWPEITLDRIQKLWEMTLSTPCAFC